MALGNKLISFLALLVTSFALSSTVHAQGTIGGGGGKWTESDLKHFLEMLRPYVRSDEGRTQFPEIVQYDRVHPSPESFDSILRDLNPSLTELPVLDHKGNVRDCVSEVTPLRFFKCNIKSLPPKPDDNATNEIKSQYYGSLYRLVLHEAFVQAGIEAPLSDDVPSDYHVSSKLTVHLESYPEWVPGTAPVVRTHDTYNRLVYRALEAQLPDKNDRGDSNSNQNKAAKFSREELLQLLSEIKIPHCRLIGSKDEAYDQIYLELRDFDNHKVDYHYSFETEGEIRARTRPPMIEGVNVHTGPDGEAVTWHYKVAVSPEELVTFTVQFDSLTIRLPYYRIVPNELEADYIEFKGQSGCQRPARY